MPPATLARGQGALVAVAVFAAVVVLAGCRRTAPACSAPAVVELRDGQGALLESLVALVPTQPGRWDRCDPQNHPAGSLVRDGASSTITDRAGRVVFHQHRSGPGDVELDNASGPRLRLHADPGELRVLLPDGLPLGSITTEGSEVTIRDRAGQVVGRVETQARGAVVLDAGGSSHRAVSPAASPADRASAGLLGIPGLSNEERAALYLLWSR